jgi:FdrA protein
MEERIVVNPNTYFDSVTLMAITQKAMRLDGVAGAMIGMGTPLNLEVLGNLGFQTTPKAGPNDLIFALLGDGARLDAALKAIEEMLVKGSKPKESKQESIRSLSQALEVEAGNLALISVPGAFAAYEARKALEKGLHVMLFSDNVSLHDEISLKIFAHERGLLVMGPDCGTAIINGVPLAFANQIRHGVIGIVGASGTGIQEVTVQIDRMGQGVSQVIGTGGRDLSKEVGGIMMLDGIKALHQDPETKVIVVISKPAAPEVADTVYQALQASGKPAVYYVIGDTSSDTGKGKVKRAGNLLEAARLAVLAAGLPAPELEEKPRTDLELARKLAQRLHPEQRYIRGLFSGGTLCDEAMVELSRKLGVIYSNGPLVPQGKLANVNKSFQHTVLDLGDDQFTVGRPHPMIDFTLRNARMLQEAEDRETGVILMDVVLGYGSNSDPTAELVPAIHRARQTAGVRKLVIIAYVCGTDQDPQNYQAQVAQLKGCGVQVCSSNLEAARLAAEVALLQTSKGGGNSGSC